MKIDKGVPLPAPKASSSGAVNILRAMETGDSFVVTREDRGRFISAALRAGVKIATRRDGDMLRIWKVGNRTEAAS